MSSMQLYVDKVTRFSCATTEDVPDIRLMNVGDSISFTRQPGGRIKDLVKSAVDALQIRSIGQKRFSIRSDYETVNVWRWR